MSVKDKQKIINSFDKIARFPDTWNQNRQYHNLLLKFVPKYCQNALDVGCGTGEFTFILSERAKSVVGIDISGIMIEEARKRHAASNIKYEKIDLEEFKTHAKFDLIVSIAAIHHLNLKEAFKKLYSLLNDGGTLIILDLYDRSHTAGLLIDFIALPLNSFFLKIRRRENPVSEEETRTWIEHKQTDKYPTFKEVKSAAKSQIGKVKIKRLLFWRYLLVYNKRP